MGPSEQMVEVESLVCTGLCVVEPYLVKSLGRRSVCGRCRVDTFWQKECQNLQVGSDLGA